MANSCWLVKSEPSVYSLDDLRRDGSTSWEGVRNYQARNFLRDQMKVGDRVLFYHSNADPPAVTGIAEVCREAYPDPTAWEAGHKYFDPRATPGNTVWVMVDIAFVAAFPRPVTLEQLRADPALEGLLVIKRGQRLSVQPVSDAHYRHICALGGFPQSPGEPVPPLSALNRT